ncbi:MULTISPECIES: polymorphic toxin-type HINT domain-containing protein [Paenibacillus]|nr:polymorphic toxin-type HINT domain-containing protein [Paenibacillus amylolyticus]
MKKFISIILIFSVLSGLFANWIPATTYAEEEQGNSNELIQILIDEFGTTEGFIQGYLDQGYNLNQILSAFFKMRESQIGFDEALSVLYPNEINESQSVTSDVYSEYSLNNDISIVSVGADQSSIMQRYDTFAVTAEVYGESDLGESKNEEEEEENSEEIEQPVTDPESGTTETEQPAVEEPAQDNNEQTGSTNIPESETTDQGQSDVPDDEKQDSTDTADVIQPLAASTSVPDPGKHITEKAPVFNKNSFNEAPYTVGENGEAISNMSGGLMLEHVDATLPGRNGMGFSLERQYNSASAQFYDMDVGYNTYDYPIYKYFVTYSAVRKKKIPKYHVKYRESMWYQLDNNGDGTVDTETSIQETKIMPKGTYTTEAEAKQVASQRIVYYTAPESRTEQTIKYAASTSNLPSSVDYNSGGFSGTLNKQGGPTVVSGEYKPARTITAPTQSCVNSIPGKYDAKGVWVQTGSESPCPQTKTATVQGQTITLTRSSVTNTKACPSPNKSVANYVCTKTWEAKYDGSVTIPASDTRSYSQTYAGTVTKPGAYSSRRYDNWVSLGGGGKQRKAYNVNELPWVETEITEGAAESTTQATDGTDYWSEASDLKNEINNYPNAAFQNGVDDGYNYYMASKPNAEIRAYQVGNGTDVTYYNKTVPNPLDKTYPLGKGWSWKLPSIETKNNKKEVVFADGGRYEIVGNTLKGYDWEGITVNPDTSAAVNGETSALVMISADGLTKQYFSTDGRLLQISDGQKNDVQFYYENNTIYNSKLLTQVKDAIGNTIRISYTASAVTIVQGNRTVTYNKQTKNGMELLDSVIDPLGRKTTYSYKLADAKFNLLGFSPERAVLNPYALLTSVQHNTGAKTFYEYENSPVKRYIGEDSFNEAYRVLSRRDQLTYENGSTEDFNRQTLSYTSDLGETYGQDVTFTTAINNGLTNTQYNYRKDYINVDTPTQFYLDRAIVSAEGKTQTISYTYGKTVKGRGYAAPTPTITSETDNQAKDVLTTTVQLDDYGNITSMTDETGRTVTSTYDDTRHWLTSMIDMVDSTNKKYTLIKRNNEGNITQIINRKDSTSGELLQQADYTYDAYGNLLTQRISDGSQERSATLEYDSRYQNAFPTKQSMVVSDVDGKQTIVSTFVEYDPVTGDMLSSTDGENHTTKYQLDALGRTVKVVQPDGKVLNASYDDMTNTITVTDESGQQQVTKWNSLGQEIEKGYFSNGTYLVSKRTGYDPYGRAFWSEDALGNRTSNFYDNWSRVISATGPDGSSTTMKYNDVARTATSTDAEGYMQIETYDKWGKVLKTEEKTQQDTGLRTLEKNKYDTISGNTMEQIDGNGNVTSFTYDVMGQLRMVINANGEQTKYVYDMMGNLTKTIDANGNIKENRYDQMGRRIQTLDKSGNVTRSYYSPNGNLTKHVDRNGNALTYDYDVRGILIRKTSPDETINFTVDALGKRTSMTDRTGTTTYQYDPSTEQLARMTYPDGLSTEFSYDLNGNRTEMKGPFGNTVYFAYDSMQRMLSVGTTKDTPDAQYSYYLNGLFKESQSQNGVNDRKTYNGLDLVYMDQIRDQSALSTYNYSYDNNKNMINRVQEGSQDTFTYDKLDRILSSSPNNEQYTYDKQGNRLTMQSDKDLNVSESEYQYDTRNRLTQVTKDAKKVGYQYNGDNLLVERTENGAVTRYYYDDDAQIIAEAEVRNGTPELKANYIRGTKLEAIAYPDGSKAYVQTNGHGDITELRNANGELLNKYQYDLWGNIVSKEEKVHNPFRYSGELWDDTTELQYLRARWYDPSLGRFITEDTFEGDLQNPMTQNGYVYAGNNALIYVDPSGNVWKWVGDSWKVVKKAGVATANFLILDDLKTFIDPKSSLFDRGMAVAGFLPVGKVFKGGKLIVKWANKEGKVINKATTTTTKVVKACNCFTAGTKVQIDGGEKNIEDIEVGDKVLSKDEETGEQAYKEVTALHRNEKDTTYKLTVGNQIIETTDNHPFWVESKGWVLAVDLKVNDKLVQSNRNHLKIDNIEIVQHDKKVKVYNFTVAEFHTYFVSSLGIWVHNIGGCLDWSKAVAHVKKHEINDLTKPSHGVFSGDAVKIVEGAWEKIKDKKIRAKYDSNQKNWYYEVIYNNAGISGGKYGDGSSLNKVRIIVNNASDNRIITAFPK